MASATLDSSILAPAGSFSLQFWSFLDNNITNHNNNNRNNIHNNSNNTTTTTTNNNNNNGGGGNNNRGSGGRRPHINFCAVFSNHNRSNEEICYRFSHGLDKGHNGYQCNNRYNDHQASHTDPSDGGKSTNMHRVTAPSTVGLVGHDHQQNVQQNGPSHQPTWTVIAAQEQPQ